MEEQQTPIQSAVRWGAIFGVISVIITLLVYIVDISLMVKWWFGLIMMAISLGYVIYAGIQYRKTIGNYMKFGKAWTHSFLLLVVAGLIGTFFNYILFGFIDPDATSVLIEAQVEMASNMAESFGAQGDALDMAIEDARDQAEGQWTGIGPLKQFGWGLIGYAIISLITGAIIKKKNPEEEVGDVV